MEEFKNLVFHKESICTRTNHIVLIINW